MPVIRRGSIDSETGNRIAGEESDAPEKVSVTPPPGFSDLAKQRQLTNLDRIQRVVQQALAGTLARDYEPKEWQVQKLNATHVEMIYDSILGMSQAEIAEKYGYSLGAMATFMTHPDALTIKSTILAASSDRVTDVSQRLQYLSQEALNVKADLLRDTRTKADLRDKIATDLLDRAGYAPKKQIEVQQESKITYVMPAQAATSMAAALEESNQIGVVDYSQHLRKPQDDEVAQAADLRLSAGHTQPSINPPLDPSLGALEASELDNDEEPGVFKLKRRSA